MVKVTYIPKGTRSQLWMGHPDLHDYTIQADLKGAREDNQIPDMGVIAQRYTLDMMGQSQKLQIRSWPPQVATHLGKDSAVRMEVGRVVHGEVPRDDAGERRRATRTAARKGLAARREGAGELVDRGGGRDAEPGRQSWLLWRRDER